MNRTTPALAALWFCSVTALAQQAAQQPTEELDEVRVTAPEPLYAAPTTRDRIGRVWVPVLIDGLGPFRLVLDTAAPDSAVTDEMVARLGLPTNQTPPVLVHGSTGSAITPTVKVGTMRVGDLLISPQRLPVVPHAYGGAEGLLGTGGMADHRIAIDFRRDRVDISRSRNRRAAEGFFTVRFLPNERNLLVVPARIGGKPVRAIIDTGANSTIGNTALQVLLRRQVERNPSGPSKVSGATGDVQTGIGARIAPIQLGEVLVRGAEVTFVDLKVFDAWKISDEPALLIGMDIIGQVDEFVIDYRRRELQIKPRS